jgi:hypothetical protein
MSNFSPMRIRVNLQEMSASAIAEMIEPGVVEEIKRSGDLHPVFRAFTLAHTGDAKGNVIGIGNVLKKWVSSVVNKLYKKIVTGLRGLQVFLGHGPTNEITADREVIGHVVGKKLTEIDGLTSAVVAIYLKPLYSAMNLDVCSLEGQVDLSIDRAGNVIADDVQEISGVALGDSRTETPGFDHARLIGQMQAFSLVGQLQAFAVEHGLTGSAEGIREGEVLSPYLDPKVNRFIRLNLGEDNVPEKTDVPADPNLDPRTNPFIKVN